ncbi:3-deoxy-D-arabino-heptulosonate 7-phosphate synthase [Pseudomonadota bacterium AL_CKDN230030165-1A_HGKHYDSX7]
MNSCPLLHDLLRGVPRPYAVPATPAALADDDSAETALAIALERTRVCLDAGAAPGPSEERAFMDALARVVDEALQQDPVFQALLLRQGCAEVAEYVSLAGGVKQDRRSVRSVVNAAAHPARLQRSTDETGRAALARLHSAAGKEDWLTLHNALAAVLAMPASEAITPPLPALQGLQEDPAFTRLRRFATLASYPRVQAYLALCAQQGPQSGSADAYAQGAASRRRGNVAEAAAADALGALVRRLNAAASATHVYRLVRSARMPGSLVASTDRAKGEWDVLVLRQGVSAAADAGWDVCLVVEVKASPDAAATDLFRLLRGLHLLSAAASGVDYTFASADGPVRLSGTSLAALSAQTGTAAPAVLYCCDTPPEPAVRLLTAASRMQLLSAPATIAYAQRRHAGLGADPHDLLAVWHDLITEPRWRHVMRQYLELRQARGLMVYTPDLAQAIDRADAPASLPAVSD